jgi:flagellar biosynthetic protein FliQ
MTTDHGVELMQSAAWMLLAIAGPALGVIVAVSLVVGILQAATQIHDPTVNSVPRLILGTLCLIWLLPWMASRLLEYTHDSFAGAMRFF